MSINDVLPSEWDKVTSSMMDAATPAAVRTKEGKDTPLGPLAKQVDGSHYQQGGIQPIEFITSNDMGFREGNVIKYVFRYKQKNGLADLKKAQHYLEMLINEYKEV